MVLTEYPFVYNFDPIFLFLISIFLTSSVKYGAYPSSIPLDLRIVINFLLSFFHSLVERGFVNYSSSCTSNNNNFEDIESLRRSLENTPIAKCDEIIFSLMGLSLANINLIVLTLLIIINILFIVRNDKT